MFSFIIVWRRLPNDLVGLNSNPTLDERYADGSVITPTVMLITLIKLIMLMAGFHQDASKRVVSSRGTLLTKEIEVIT